MIPRGHAACSLAEQFDHQEKQAKELADVFMILRNRSRAASQLACDGRDYAALSR
jgi:hypothetical protein